MNAQTYTKSGSKATSAAKLDAAVFDIKVTNHDLLKQAYIAYQANGRKNLAKTLRRGEVRGGGKKPWKQKGTGRARFGSIRVPIWRGGGIVFGPLGNENYSRDLNVKAKRQAIRQALSVNAKNISIVDLPDFKDGKTSEAAQFLHKIGASRSILLVVKDKNDAVTRATRNLSDVTVVSAMYLNVFDIMNAHNIVMTKDALDVVTTWLGTANKKEATK